MLSTSLPAYGALGGDIASIQADQVHLQGSVRITAGAGYAMHEIQASSGTVVREYISSGGQVFAVAWQGPWPPDMRQLLGSYFEQYVQAAQSQSAVRRGRRPLMIELPGLVVQLSGHPRSFSGKAYLPDRLPANVRAQEIR